MILRVRIPVLLKSGFLKKLERALDMGTSSRVSTKGQPCTTFKAFGEFLALDRSNFSASPQITPVTDNYHGESVSIFDMQSAIAEFSPIPRRYDVRNLCRIKPATSLELDGLFLCNNCADRPYWSCLARSS